jgi:hypothetical protein
VPQQHQRRVAKLVLAHAPSLAHVPELRK